MYRFFSSSEIECYRGYFEVLVLAEFILECGEELRVDFESELFKVLNDTLNVSFFVAGPLFHLAVPGIDLLNALGRENKGCSCELRGLVLEEEGVQEGDLKHILGKEKDLVI
jgi:hypothetical protein